MWFIILTDDDSSVYRNRRLIKTFNKVYTKLLKFILFIMEIVAISLGKRK